MKREVCVLVVLLLILPVASAGYRTVNIIDHAADDPLDSECTENVLVAYTECRHLLGQGASVAGPCDGVQLRNVMIKFSVEDPSKVRQGFIEVAGGSVIRCWLGRTAADATGVLGGIRYTISGNPSNPNDVLLSRGSFHCTSQTQGQCGCIGSSIAIPASAFHDENVLYCEADAQAGLTISSFGYEIDGDYSKAACLGEDMGPADLPRVWRDELLSVGNACCGDDEEDFARGGDNGRVVAASGKSVLCYKDPETDEWAWHDAEVDGGEAFVIKPLPAVPAVPAPFVPAVPARDYISNKLGWMVCDAQHVGPLTIPSSLRGVDQARAAKFFCANHGDAYRWQECCDPNAALTNERSCENVLLPERFVHKGGAATQITSFENDLIETMERSGDVLRIEENPQSGSHRLEITDWEDFTDLEIIYKVSSHYDVEVQLYNGNTLVQARKLSELIEEDSPRIDGFMRAMVPIPINPPTVDLTPVGPTKVDTQHWDCPVGKVACGAEDSGALGGGGYSDVLLGKVRCCDPKGFIVGAKSGAIMRAVNGEAICSNNGVICGIREGFSHLESFIKMVGVQCCSSSGIATGARRLVSLAPRGSGTSGFLCQSGEVLCGVKPSSIENSFFAQGYCCAVTSSDPGKITRVDFRFVPKGDPSLPRSNIFTLRSAYLVAGGARYCTDARYSDTALKSSWIADLDDRTGGASIGTIPGEPAGKSACNALGFGWTGTQCCGDDGREFYSDSEAGCWNGEIVKDNTIMTVEYGQHAYGCPSGECLYPSETSANQQPLLYNIFSDLEKTTASSVPQQMLFTNKFLGCLRSNIPSMNPGVDITDVPLCSVHGDEKFLCSILDEGWKEKTVTEPHHVSPIIPGVNILKNPRFDEFDAAQIPKYWHEALHPRFNHFQSAPVVVNATHHGNGTNVVVIQSNNRGEYGIESDGYIVQPLTAFTALVNATCRSGEAQIQLLFWNNQQVNWLSGYRVSTSGNERLIVNDIVPTWAERVSILLSASNVGQPPVDCAFDDVQLVFNETNKPAPTVFTHYPGYDGDTLLNLPYVNPILGGYSCCEENKCWDGKQCVENMAATPDALPIANYRCIDGSWIASPEKTDLKGNKGFCPTEQQCLVSVDGNNEFNNNVSKFYRSSKPEDWPQCISDKQFFSDNYCDAGIWTSRTRLIAKELLDLVSARGDPNKYTLYCDDYEHSLVSINDILKEAVEGKPQLAIDAKTGEEKIDASSTSCFADGTSDASCINHFCVLKYIDSNAHSNKTVVGMSLNVRPGNVTPLFDFSKTACKRKGIAGFEKCDGGTNAGTATVWFDDISDLLVYSRDGVDMSPPGPVQAFFTAITGL
ncbi:MAG TPA: hypothetical protein VJK72_00225, partial [Candidatus Nanoarchaeia archaeon]|nr:hypothetical protein [Candidatus Nanoarchaeia archaeon]